MYDVCINNLSKIKNEIKSLFEYYFLKPKETCIIAVSKNRSAEQIQPLLQENHRVFGENKVQEAIDKWGDLKKQYPDIQLHMIGALLCRLLLTICLFNCSINADCFYAWTAQDLFLKIQKSW